VLRFVRDTAHHAPDDMMIVAGLLTGPDHSTKLAGIVVGHFGAPEAAAAAVQPIKAFGSPVLDAMGPIPYVQLNGLLDESLPRGARNYWKSHFVSELTDDVIDALVDGYARRPSAMSQIVIENFHGAATRIAPTATAFAMRAPGYNILLLGQWQGAADDRANIAWVRETSAALQPLAAAQRYVNYLDNDDSGDAALGAVYGPNVKRLRELKKKYDPANVFHLNVNIPPA
jgi:FAD/FMN-containing dehydrogenase